jgi:hypothetical protein
MASYCNMYTRQQRRTNLGMTSSMCVQVPGALFMWTRTCPSTLRLTHRVIGRTSRRIIVKQHHRCASSATMAPQHTNIDL